MRGPTHTIDAVRENPRKKEWNERREPMEAREHPEIVRSIEARAEGANVLRVEREIATEEVGHDDVVER
jgi:hypothetical protein